MTTRHRCKKVRGKRKKGNKEKIGEKLVLSNKVTEGAADQWTDSIIGPFNVKFNQERNHMTRGFHMSLLGKPKTREDIHEPGVPVF